MQYLNTYQQRINTFLEHNLSNINCPEKLKNALHYAVLNGGKRFRACLVYGAAEAFNGHLNIADPIAAAIEYIHAYSLVHDDLPAMDDSHLRRGQPSCHIAYDEATAILVGDSLQSMAFTLLSSANNIAQDKRINMIEILAKACGPEGMAGGQMLDLHFTGANTATLADLHKMHTLKTSALIKASVQLGALTSSNYSATMMDNLSTYSDALGLGFQIRDDILDCCSSSDVMGKPQRLDHQQQKSTFVTILGLEASKSHCAKLLITALENVGKLPGNTKTLEVLAKLAVDREF